MSNDENDDQTPADGQNNHKAGYGNPPQGSRFKKGRSGNPKGRPKGSKNNASAASLERYREIFRKEAYRMVNVRKDGKTVSMTMAEAAARSIATNAAKGRPGAQKIFSGTLSAIEREEKVKRDECIEIAIEYKYGWELELRNRKLLGQKGQQPLIHPDQIKVDHETNEIWIEGPTSKEHLEEIQQRLDVMNKAEEYLPSLYIELKSTDDEVEKKDIQNEIDHIFRLIEARDKLLQNLSAAGCHWFEPD